MTFINKIRYLKKQIRQLWIAYIFKETIMTFKETNTTFNRPKMTFYELNTTLEESNTTLPA